MSNDTVIQVSNLTKTYKLYDKPSDRLKEALNPFGKKYHREFYALRDISFSVGRGEIVGFVGNNGAGKSTVLQIITGVLTPTSGSVLTKGKISALLELGAGFNPELTGIENVYFKSSLLGYSTEDVEENLDEILSFADIGDFIYQPVKTYSSGMFVRLAFAVAINVEPDILIVDEALSVGDFRFRQKCMRKFDDFLQANKTILFVTHDHGAVVQYCTKAVWLKDGAVQRIGSPHDVCKNYISYMSYGEIDDGADLTLPGNNLPGKVPVVSEKTKYTDISWEGIGECASFGEGGAEVLKVCLVYQKNHKKIEFFEGGERVIFFVKVLIHQDISDLIVGFHLSSSKGVNLLGMNSYVAGVNLVNFTIGDEIVVEFEFDFPYLLSGQYSFSPAVAEGTQEDHIQHHWVHDAYIVRVVGDKKFEVLGSQFVIKDNFEIRVG